MKQAMITFYFDDSQCRPRRDITMLHMKNVVEAILEPIEEGVPLKVDVDTMVFQTFPQDSVTKEQLNKVLNAVMPLNQAHTDNICLVCRAQVNREGHKSFCAIKDIIPSL